MSAGGPLSPVPASATVCGLAAALSASVSAPEREPEAEGVNVTWMVQLAPGARLTPQSLASAKSPATEMLPSDKVPPPMLVSVTACAALESPCCWAANVRLAGASATPGIAPATPLPLSCATCGLPAASSLTVSWPARGPVLEGRKLTRIAQLFPAASAEPQLLVWVKSPLATMEVKFSGAALKLANVTVWLALAAPTVWSPKTSLLGDSTALWAAATAAQLSASMIALAEREGEGLHAGIEEFDLEGAVLDGSLLPDQLIQPMEGDGAHALGIGVGAVIGARGGAVNGDLEANGLAIRRTQHQMKIAGVEAVNDGAVRLFEHRHLRAHFPSAGQAPLIVGGANGGGVGRGLVNLQLLR